MGLLIDKGYNADYGARPLRRAIERLIEDPMAEHLLREELGEGITLYADLWRPATPSTSPPSPPPSASPPRRNRASSSRPRKPGSGLTPLHPASSEPAREPTRAGFLVRGVSIAHLTATISSALARRVPTVLVDPGQKFEGSSPFLAPSQKRA